ncbi:MAG: PDZ domain-containing protein [Planctomycetota bacterium]
MSPTRLLSCLCLPAVFSACSFTREPLPLPPSFQAMESAVAEAPASSAFLGLTTELNQPEDAFSLDIPPGVRVVAVEEHSPAQAAGLAVGDIVLSFDGHPTDDPQRLTTLLDNISKQRDVVLRLQRGSEVLEADVTLEMRSNQTMRHLYHVDRGFLRAAFRDDARGLPEVVEMAAESPLVDAGVRKGDVILAFQGADPGSAKEFVRRARVSLHPGDPIVLIVQGPKGSQRTIETSAWDPGSALTEFGLWPLFFWSREVGRDRGEFRIGMLVITDLFRYSRDGQEKEYSILSLLQWETGELVLEDGLSHVQNP